MVVAHVVVRLADDVVLFAVEQRKSGPADRENLLAWPIAARSVARMAMCVMVRRVRGAIAPTTAAVMGVASA